MNDAAGILLRCVAGTRSPARSEVLRVSSRPTQQSAGSGPTSFRSKSEPKMNRLHLSRPVITGADVPLDGHILRTSVAFLLIHSPSKQSTHLISSVEAIMGPGTDASSWVDPCWKLFHWHCHTKAKWRQGAGGGKNKEAEYNLWQKISRFYKCVFISCVPQEASQAWFRKLHWILLVPHQCNVVLNQTTLLSFSQNSLFNRTTK